MQLSGGKPSKFASSNNYKYGVLLTGQCAPKLDHHRLGGYSTPYEDSSRPTASNLSMFQDTSHQTWDPGDLDLAKDENPLCFGNIRVKTLFQSYT